jgi:hypothetical protein
MSEQENFVTPIGIASFPYLFKKNEFGNNPKYEMTLLLDKEAYDSKEMKALRGAVKRLCIEKFGDEPKNVKGWQSPFKDGNDKYEDDPEKYAVYEDKYVFTAKSQYEPGIVDAKRQPILDEEQFYAGCKARLSVNLYAWEYMKKKGVGLGLQFVQKTAEGEKLGGGKRSAEDVFDAVEGNNDDDDFGDDDI